MIRSFCDRHKLQCCRLRPLRPFFLFSTNELNTDQICAMTPYVCRRTHTSIHGGLHHVLHIGSPPGWGQACNLHGLKEKQQEFSFTAWSPWKKKPKQGYVIGWKTYAGMIVLICKACFTHSSLHCLLQNCWDEIFGFWEHWQQPVVVCIQGVCS